MSVSGGRANRASFPLDENQVAEVRGTRAFKAVGIDQPENAPDGTWKERSTDAEDLFDFLNELNDLVAVVLRVRANVEWGQDGNFYGLRIHRQARQGVTRTEGETTAIEGLEQGAFEIYSSLPGNPALATGAGAGWSDHAEWRPTWPNLYMWALDSGDTIRTSVNGDATSSTDINVKWSLEYVIAEVVE